MCHASGTKIICIEKKTHIYVGTSKTGLCKILNSLEGQGDNQIRDIGLNANLIPTYTYGTCV